MTPRWYGRLNVGYAGIGGGRLTDDDYGSNGGQRLFSSTNSDISGNSMWYLNADGGFRLVNIQIIRGWLDVFGGFQYWYTKYEATGVTQVACDNIGCASVVGPYLQSNRNRDEPRADSYYQYYQLVLDSCRSFDGVSTDAAIKPDGNCGVSSADHHR